MAKEIRTPRRDDLSPNPNHSIFPVAGGVSTAPPELAGTFSSGEGISIDGANEDEFLRQSEVLSREEVLRRRSRRLKQLAKCSIRQYWAYMEELRVKHRDYYWEHGLSPYEEEAAAGGPLMAEINGGEVNGGLGLDEGDKNESNCTAKKGERKRCAFSGCKSKAMPLTRFCYPHILADPEQMLYKACIYVTKSCGQSGPITCGKPVLRSALPAYCHVHFQKNQRNISQALKKAGLNIPSSSRAAPKFSVLIAEYIHQIQARRREASGGNLSRINTEEG